MDFLLSYLIKSLLISSLLTVYYLAALRNRRFHPFNRSYLLAVPGLSLVLPLIRFNWDIFTGKTGEPLGKMFTRIDYPGPSPAAVSYRYLEIALGFTIFVSLVLLLTLLYRVLQVRRLKSKHSCRQMEDYVLIETDEPAAPFSFFKNLFWKRGADTEDPINKKILAHELTHIHGRHTWDILYIQSVASLFWMNPFFWFVRREIAMIHEFIADAASDMDGDTESFARMLLRSRLENRPLQPIHGFFHSPIKRRLIMITHTGRPTRSFLRKALALPVVLALVVLFSCSKEGNRPLLRAMDSATIQKMKAEIILTKLLISNTFKLSIKFAPGKIPFVANIGKEDLTRISFSDGVKLTLKTELDSAQRVALQK